MKMRLARLLWQFIRHNVFLALLMTIFAAFLLTYQEPRGLLLLIDLRLIEIPLFVWLIATFLLVGIIAGVIQALPLKRRIDEVVHGAMRFERGTFSHRLTEQGADELTELAVRMNRMAAQIEEQIASLQRLSTERVKMQDTVKKAAVTEERQRLARELHDAVSQQLFAISMMTAALRSSDEKQEEQLEMVEKMANTAQAEMRALLLHLRPAHLEGKSLEEGAGQLFLELEKKHDVEVSFLVDIDSDLPQGIEDQMYRLIQEAISNILRHSEANAVEFLLKEMPQEVIMKIIDNGVGFKVDDISQESYGLQTMKERMNDIGGVLNIVSVPLQGTQLEVKIPIAWKGNEKDEHKGERNGEQPGESTLSG
ncbi:HAMP domain-containing sensor histidine kinase [Alkalihalophilus pseudofirmus]|nr:sensor histidine kinase [Alkalihalophilus pseudofirmus]